MNDTLFAPVREALDDAVLIAWDGCHKIYLAMDDIEAAWFRGTPDEEGYPYVFAGTPAAMAETLLSWWDDSCGLRFVEAVSHNAEDPNAGFVSLIAQFADEEDDDEDDPFDTEDDDEDEEDA